MAAFPLALVRKETALMSIDFHHTGTRRLHHGCHQRGARVAVGNTVGNAVGSCICNIGLILGTTAAIRTVTLQPAALARPLGMMFAVSLALVIFTLDFRLGRAGVGLLLAAGVFYFVWDFLHHLRRRDAAALTANTMTVAARRNWRSADGKVIGETLIFGALAIAASNQRPRSHDWIAATRSVLGFQAEDGGSSLVSP
jgi:hypothetical protein